MSMLLGSSLGMTCLLSLLVKASKSNPVPANPVWANLANTLITAAMDGVPLGPAMVKILSDLCLNFLLTTVPRLLWILGRSRLTHWWTFQNHRERYLKTLIPDPDKRNGFFWPDHISDLVGISERICRELRIQENYICNQWLPNTFQHIQAEDFEGDDSSPWHIDKTYNQWIDGDRKSGEGIFKTCEDSFSCNLIYFSPVLLLPDQQASRKWFLRSSFTSSEKKIW